MAVPKFYAVTDLTGILVANRDVNGIYFLRTANGFKAYRVANTVGKEWIPDDLTDYEQVSNKVTALSSPSNVTYPTTKAVSDALALKANSSSLDSKLNLGDVIMNTNPFGGRHLYINSINNALFSASKRWNVTATIYNSSDDSVNYVLSPGQILSFFDGNYESYYAMPANTYLVLTIDFAGQFPNYPYGSLYLSHYYTSYSTSASMRVYCNYEPQGIGWKTLNFSTLLDNNGVALITYTRNTYYAISIMEFTIRNDKSTTCGITQVEFNLDRPATTDMPLVDKYKANSLYYDLTFKNSTDGTSLTLSALGFIAASGSISSSTSINAPGGNSGNWNTAYGWGNHSSVGYFKNNYIFASGALPADADTVHPSGGFTGNYNSGNAIANVPVSTYGGLITYASNTNNNNLQLHYGNGHGGVESLSAVYFRTKHNAGWTLWKKLWSSYDFLQSDINAWKTSYNPSNFLAGINYLAPNGNGSNLTGVTKQPPSAYGGTDNSVTVLDTRSVNDLPNVKRGGVWFDFKQKTVIELTGTGAPGYAAVITMNPYIDASGSGLVAFRLAQSGGNMYFQESTLDTTNWNSWKKLLNDSNFLAGTNYLAPNGSAAALTNFPILNQNTTGNAGSVTNGLYSTGSYSNPAWLTSLAASKVTGLATVATSGSYNDLLNKPAAYSLPTASATTLGGIKIGNNLTIVNGVVDATDTTYTLVTSTVNGLMSSSDKTKLDGVATGATKNATDAQLRDRSTHTGTQAASTVTGLAVVATSGSYNDLSSKPTIPTNNNQLANGAGYITSVPAQSFSSLTGKPTTLSGYGITDGVNSSNPRTTTDLDTEPGGYSEWYASFPAHMAPGTYNGGSITFIGSSNDLQIQYDSGHNDGKGALYFRTRSIWLSQPTWFSWQKILSSNDIAPVASTGDYDDLFNKPTIPTNNNQLVNGAGYITNVPAQTWSSITSKPTTISGYGITDAEPKIAAGTTSQYWSGNKTWQATSGLPVSIATQTALNLKANLAGNQTFTGTNTFAAINATSLNIVSGGALTVTGRTYLGEVGNTAGDFLTRNSADAGVNTRTPDQVLFDIKGEYQQPYGTIRVNLGYPTVREAALFQAQFSNKFEFVLPNTIEESTDSGTTWTTSSISPTSNSVKDLMVGRGVPSDLFIPFGHQMRFTFISTGYFYLNHLYVYWSSNHPNQPCAIKIEKQDEGSQVWNTLVTTSPAGGWPVHCSVPHDTISFFLNVKVRLTFIPTWSMDTTNPYYGNPFSLYSIEWWGGYPAGRRDLYITDRDKGATFPAALKATSFVKSGGTASQFLKADGSVDSNTYLSNADLSLYAPKNSPALTGVPTAPTAGYGTANTQIATTQFVDNALYDVGVIIVLSSRSLDFGDHRANLIVSSTSAITITVPNDTSVDFVDGSQVTIIRQGTGEVTITGESGVTIGSADNCKRLRVQYSAGTLVKVNTNEWILMGDLKL